MPESRRLGFLALAECICAICGICGQNFPVGSSVENPTLAVVGSWRETPLPFDCIYPAKILCPIPGSRRK